MNSTDPEQSARFVAMLTGLQSRLYAFLCTLFARPDEARDVLQETNFVLWKKAAEGGRSVSLPARKALAECIGVVSRHPR